MNNYLLIYKTQLVEKAPYQQSASHDYINFLEHNTTEVYQGNIGLYWSRLIESDGQKLYFPFVDIDPFLDKVSHGEIELINDSIFRAKIFIQALSKLGVLNRFKFIATGGYGFRAISNILLNQDDYDGFVGFIKTELNSCLIDYQPSENTTAPYQILARKDNPFQNHKQLVGRHSTLVDSNWIMDGFSYYDYCSITSNELNPYSYVEAARELLSFTIISDVSSLGEYGSKIQLYKELSKHYGDRKIKFFDISKQFKAISSDKTFEILNSHGYSFKEIDKGIGKIYTFSDKTCPACGHSNGNAFITPPYFRLKCFRSSCPASISNGGLSLNEWSGVFLQNENKSQSRVDLDITPQKMTLDEAQQAISAHLNSNSDVFLKVTPGSGKTHLALKYACEQALLGKKIIYSTYNVVQVDEACNVALQNLANNNLIHRLHTQEASCIYQGDYKSMVDLGYSPSTLLCKRCPEKENCEYYTERKKMYHGIYFTTHHMLSELDPGVFQADIIIIDENISPLALSENESFTEANLRALSAHVEGHSAAIIGEIIKLVTDVYNKKTSKYHEILLVKNYHETNHDNILDFLSQKLSTTSVSIIETINNTVEILKKNYSQLYVSQVNYNAVRWLSGFYEEDVFSCIYFKNNGIVEFYTKQINKPLLFNSRYIFLDATGNDLIVNKICNKSVQPKNIGIDWNCRATFIEKNIKKSTDIHDNEMSEIIETGLSHFTRDKVLIVSFKSNCEQLLNICSEIKPDTQFEFYNFFGQKGTNQFKDFDAIFVIGLPYPNINTAWQDAHILFPGVDQDGLRDSWPYIAMESELLQLIHRVRPVRKDHPIELVVAGNSYPGSLPEPSQRISFKRREDPVGTAVDRLRKFIDYFGFYDVTLEYIAGVATTDSESKATQFRKLLFDTIGHLVAQHKAQYLKAGPDCEGTEGTHTCSRSTLSIHHFISNLYVHLQKLKIIDTERKAQSSTIIDTIMEIDRAFDWKSITFNNDQIDSIDQNEIKSFTLKLFTLYLYLNETEWEVNLPMHLVHKNQARDTRTQLKNEFEHMSKYKIKSLHSKYNNIEGVEIENNGLYFYAALAKLDIINNVLLTSYRQEHNNNYLECDFNILLVYFSQNKTYTLTKNKFHEYHVDTIDNIKTNDSYDFVVTNNHKQCFNYFSKNTVGSVHDIFLTHRIIFNNNSDTSLDLIGLGSKYDVETDFSTGYKSCKSIYNIYQKQMDLLKTKKICYIYQMESEILLLNNKYLKSNGFSVNGEKLDQMKAIASTANNLNDERTLETIEKLVQKDGKFPSIINQIETTTGRSGYKILSTLNKKFRLLFLPSEGHVILAFDIKHFEPTIISSLSNDIYALGLINSGKDIYTEVAMSISGALNNGRFNDRTFGKVLFNIAINGGNEHALISRCYDVNISITRSSATQIYTNFKNMFPTIFKFQNRILQMARSHCKIYTKFSRVLYVDDDVKDSTIVNFVVQGSGADAFKRLLLKVNGSLKHPDEGIIFHHYDAIYIQVPENGAAKRVVALKEIIEDSLSSDFGNVRFSVAASMRRSWAEEDTIMQA